MDKSAFKILLNPDQAEVYKKQYDEIGMTLSFFWKMLEFLTSTF